MAAACVMQAGKSAISRSAGTSAINDGLSHSSSAVGRRSVNNEIGKWVWADCLGVNRRDSALELTAGQGMEDAREEGGQKERLYDAVILNKQTRGRAGDHHADVVDKGDREKGSRRENASTCGKICVLEQPNHRGVVVPLVDGSNLPHCSFRPSRRQPARPRTIGCWLCDHDYSYY